MRILTTLVLFLCSFVVWGAVDDEFPGRKLYHDVSVFSLDDLGKKHENVNVVDVRTPYEFETIHIKNAVNIPLSRGDFVKQIAALRKENDKPIVFYCNGHTCFKSYKAARKAQVFGVTGVHSFDAGVFDWANAHPDKTVLLGKSPIDTSKLISKKSFKSKLISPKEFEEKVKSGKYFVIDVRSRIQRSAMGLFPFTEKWASLDDNEKLKDLLEQAKAEKKGLLIYDNVGKQVSWLEYRLRDMGITDYLFMQGGAEEYFVHLQTKENAVVIPKNLLELSK